MRACCPTLRRPGALRRRGRDAVRPIAFPLDGAGRTPDLPLCCCIGSRPDVSGFADWLGDSIVGEATVICVIIAVVLTFAMTVLCMKLSSSASPQGRGVGSRDKEIIRKAQLDVENRRREAELEIKEMTLQQQAESEKELLACAGNCTERERLLDKRQDALEEQAETVRKQEKMSRKHAYRAN